MAKIYSRYLTTFYEVNSNKVHNDDGTEEEIVTHRSLEDIILNQLPEELGFTYRFEPWPNSHHAVVSCIMSDKKGRQVQTVGEAVSITLDTKVAKDNPTAIAAQRAFDKAATKYLALESKAVIKDEPTSAVPAAPKAEEKPKTIKTSVVSKNEAPMNSAPMVDEDLEVVEDAVIQYADLIEEEEFATPDNSAENDTANAKNNDGDVIINMGRYARNPQKLSYIYENDQKWLSYVTEKVQITDANREQIEAGKRYIEFMEKGGK